MLLLGCPSWVFGIQLLILVLNSAKPRSCETETFVRYIQYIQYTQRQYCAVQYSTVQYSTFRRTHRTGRRIRV